MQEVTLYLKHIHFSYHQNNVLKDINLEVKKGESLGIVGPNGGGKSTLLKLITGGLNPNEGEISFGTDKSLGYVPQNITLNYTMPISVVELIQMNQTKNNKTLFNLDQLLNLVGLENKRDQLIRTLSGGERQRALIARAMISSPRLLVLDEPTTGLDSTGQDQLYSLLNRLKAEHNTSIVVVDHNLSQIIKHCDKILCLNRTSHWHDQKELLTKDVLSSIYHCEFEHIMIHEGGLADESHDQCEHGPGGHHEHQHGSKHEFLRPKK